MTVCREVGLPFRPGQVVALGLSGDRCPVGVVEYVDDTWISITHFNWLIGEFCAVTRAVRIADVLEVLWADGYDSAEEGRYIFDMDPLGTFQTQWTKKEDASPRR